MQTKPRGTKGAIVGSISLIICGVVLSSQIIWVFPAMADLHKYVGPLPFLGMGIGTILSHFLMFFQLVPVTWDTYDIVIISFSVLAALLILFSIVPGGILSSILGFVTGLLTILHNSQGKADSKYPTLRVLVAVAAVLVFLGFILPSILFLGGVSIFGLVGAPFIGTILITNSDAIGLPDFATWFGPKQGTQYIVLGLLVGSIELAVVIAALLFSLVGTTLVCVSSYKARK